MGTCSDTWSLVPIGEIQESQEASLSMQFSESG
jgi:hypothetical protein